MANSSGERAQSKRRMGSVSFVSQPSWPILMRPSVPFHSPTFICYIAPDMASNDQHSGHDGQGDETLPPRDNSRPNSNVDSALRLLQQSVGFPSAPPVVLQVPVNNSTDANTLLAALSAQGMLVSLLPQRPPPVSVSVSQLLQAAVSQQQPAASTPRHDISQVLPVAATNTQGGTIPSTNTWATVPASGTVLANSLMPATTVNVAAATLFNRPQPDSATSGQAAATPINRSQPDSATVATSSQVAINSQHPYSLPAPRLREAVEPPPSVMCIYLDNDELELSPYQCLVR